MMFWFIIIRFILKKFFQIYAIITAYRYRLLQRSNTNGKLLFDIIKTNKNSMYGIDNQFQSIINGTKSFDSLPLMTISETISKVNHFQFMPYHDLVLMKFFPDDFMGDRLIIDAVHSSDETMNRIVNAVLNPIIWCMITSSTKSTYYLVRFMTIRWKQIIFNAKLRDFKKNFNRLQFLESINPTTDELFCSKIWPRLKVIVCDKFNYSVFYQIHIKKYLNDIPIVSSKYATNIDQESNFILYPIDTAFEFGIMYKDGKSVTINRVVQMNNLIPNVLYELISTTYEGLYRYRTGDLIEFLHYNNHLPVIRYVQRIEDYLQINNELQSVVTIEYELINICNKTSTFFIDYLFYVQSNGKIIIYLEVDKLSREIETWTKFHSFQLVFVYIDTFMKLNEYLGEMPRVVTDNLGVKKFMDDNRF